MIQPITVMIVDDSALVRDLLRQGLSLDHGIQVVGMASNGQEAMEKALALRPQVITLDVEMPGGNGVDFLRRLMPLLPTPVVMVSALTQKGKSITLESLEAGAVDFVSKPSADAAGLSDMLLELRTKIKIASMANLSHWKSRRESAPVRVASRGVPSKEKLVAIGASTGGTEALRVVLSQLPKDMPGIVVVQHMPPGFTALFSHRLNEICQMEVKEAEDGDVIHQGTVYIAPGGRHLKVVRSGGHYKIVIFDGQKVNGHMPSVDVMMASVALEAAANAVGIMLTGMGQDGSDGMVAMRKAGARNIAQDEETSVVFGMPKMAYEKGGAEKLVPLHDIAHALLDLVH